MDLEVRQRGPWEGQEFGPETDVDHPLLPDTPESETSPRRKKLKKKQREVTMSLPRTYADAVKFRPLKPQPVESEGHDVAEESGDSDEEWNYIKGSINEENKENINDSADMESQLNPNAAEFVPGVISVDDDEVVLSCSPCKDNLKNLDNMVVPSEKEFIEDISSKPSELDDYFSEKKPVWDPNESRSEDVDVSTVAVCGDDSIQGLSLNNSTLPNGHKEDEERDNPFIANAEVNDVKVSPSSPVDFVLDHFAKDSDKLENVPFASAKSSNEPISLSAEISSHFYFIDSHLEESREKKTESDVLPVIQESTSLGNELSFNDILKSKSEFNELQTKNNPFDIDALENGGADIKENASTDEFSFEEKFEHTSAFNNDSTGDKVEEFSKPDTACNNEFLPSEESKFEPDIVKADKGDEEEAKFGSSIDEIKFHNKFENNEVVEEVSHDNCFENIQDVNYTSQEFGIEEKNIEVSSLSSDQPINIQSIEEMSAPEDKIEEDSRQNENNNKVDGDGELHDIENGFVPPHVDIMTASFHEFYVQNTSDTFGRHPEHNEHAHPEQHFDDNLEFAYTNRENDSHLTTEDMNNTVCDNESIESCKLNEKEELCHIEEKDVHPVQFGDEAQFNSSEAVQSIPYECEVTNLNNDLEESRLDRDYCYEKDYVSEKELMTGDEKTIESCRLNEEEEIHHIEGKDVHPVQFGEEAQFNSSEAVQNIPYECEVTNLNNDLEESRPDYDGIYEKNHLSEKELLIGDEKHFMDKDDRLSPAVEEEVVITPNESTLKDNKIVIDETASTDEQAQPVDLDSSFEVIQNVEQTSEKFYFNSQGESIESRMEKVDEVVGLISKDNVPLESISDFEEPAQVNQILIIDAPTANEISEKCNLKDGFMVEDLPVDPVEGDIVPAVLEEEVKVLPEEVVQAVPEEVVLAVPEEAVQPVLEEAVQAVPEETVQAAPEEVQAVVEEAIPTVPEVVPSATEEVIPTAPEEVIPTAPEETVQTATDEVSTAAIPSEVATATVAAIAAGAVGAAVASKAVAARKSTTKVEATTTKAGTTKPAAGPVKRTGTPLSAKSTSTATKPTSLGAKPASKPTTPVGKATSPSAKPKLPSQSSTTLKSTASVKPPSTGALKPKTSTIAAAKSTSAAPKSTTVPAKTTTAKAPVAASKPAVKLTATKPTAPRAAPRPTSATSASAKPLSTVKAAPTAAKKVPPTTKPAVSSTARPPSASTKTAAAKSALTSTTLRSVSAKPSLSPAAKTAAPAATKPAPIKAKSPASSASKPKTAAAPLKKTVVDKNAKNTVKNGVSVKKPVIEPKAMDGLKEDELAVTSTTNGLIEHIENGKIESPIVDLHPEII